mmetsp:Transcript_10480/g.64137  ORF Transcript_10480/g.64137 Transcript_10480/m.64137 type:complete len:275 (-) Transcript_10480:4320-5144(-)
MRTTATAPWLAPVATPTMVSSPRLLALRAPPPPSVRSNSDPKASGCASGSIPSISRPRAVACARDGVEAGRLACVVASIPTHGRARRQVVAVRRMAALRAAGGGNGGVGAVARVLGLVGHVVLRRDLCSDDPTTRIHACGEPGHEEGGGEAGTCFGAFRAVDDGRGAHPRDGRAVGRRSRRRVDAVEAKPSERTKPLRVVGVQPRVVRGRARAHGHAFSQLRLARRDGTHPPGGRHRTCHGLRVRASREGFDGRIRRERDRAWIRRAGTQGCVA